MRIVWFWVRKKSKRGIHTSMKDTKVERFLFVTFLFFFTTMLIVQAGMMDEGIRTFLQQSNNYDGVPLTQTVNLFDEGELGIELVDSEKNENVHILINGEPVLSFANRIAFIKVKNNDLVEIDGSRVTTPVKVRILTRSSNIKSEVDGKEMVVNGTILPLTRVVIDD